MDLKNLNDINFSIPNPKYCVTKNFLYGIFNEMFFVRIVFVCVSRGRISEYPGTSNTSSYVRASELNLLLSIDMANKFLILFAGQNYIDEWI